MYSITATIVTAKDIIVSAPTLRDSPAAWLMCYIVSLTLNLMLSNAFTVMIQNCVHLHFYYVSWIDLCAILRDIIYWTALYSVWMGLEHVPNCLISIPLSVPKYTVTPIINLRPSLHVSRVVLFVHSNEFMIKASSLFMPKPVFIGGILNNIIHLSMVFVWVVVLRLFLQQLLSKDFMFKDSR